MKRFLPLVWVIVALALAAPISFYVFDVGIGQLVERAYYTLLGAGIMLAFFCEQGGSSA